MIVKKDTSLNLNNSTWALPRHMHLWAFTVLSPLDRILLVFTVTLLFWLKAFYSVWGVQELVWILKPTTVLVQLFSGLSFYFDPARGYVCPEAAIVIGPSCAGINYLITASLMGIFYIIPRLHIKHKPLILTVTLLMTYLLTIAVNSLRISGSIVINNIARELAYTLPHRLHDAQGIAVFLFFLILYFQFLKFIFRDKETSHERI